MTGYERANKYDIYYTADPCNSTSTKAVFETEDDNDEYDKLRYENANYYSSIEVAENNARADKLMRQLRRYAVEHNDGEINWNNSGQEKVYIEYNTAFGRIGINYALQLRELGQIYFTSSAIAEQAISEFKDELLWYFTEYQDHIVGSDTEVECIFCGNTEKLKALTTFGFKFCPECGKKLGGAEK